MHSKQIVLTLSTIAILSIGLAGCGNGSTNHRNHPATSTSQTSSTNHEASALWNNSKDQKLSDFMNQWAPTMNQSYTKYNGHHQLKVSTGAEYPADLHKTTVNGSNASIGWAPSGKGSYDYNVVALYNYNKPGAPTGGHITYAFAFHNGEPVALVDESTNGTPNWTPTENSDISSNFASIANNSQSNSSQNASSSSASSSSDKGSVHLTGADSSVAYIKSKMGDQNWTVEGGNYGKGEPSSDTYNSLRNDNGDIYYVYQDGRIEKAND